MSAFVTVHKILVSPGHNFYGRYGQPAGSHPVIELPRVVCRAGWGLEGDRFYGYRPDYKGQVTFFSWEVLAAAREKFGLADLHPGAFRRNVVVEGIELNALIGRRFSLGGVEFEGTAEARPCHWMNTAVAPGAEDWLMGRGGLRTKVLTTGELVTGSVPIWLFQEVA